MFDLNRKDGDTARSVGKEAEGSGRAKASGVAANRQSGSGQFAVIGRSIQISGDVKGDEDLLIEGDVSGTIELKNHSLTIGQEGKVKANIFAGSISVNGATDGDLYASESIAIKATATVRGKLLAPRISLEDGARKDTI